MAMMLGPVDKKTLKALQQKPINCHPDSQCPACQPKKSPLNPRQRLLRNAQRNLSNPGRTITRAVTNPVKSLQSGGQVLWDAVTKW